MDIQAVVKAITPVESGVSKNGHAWSKCIVIIEEAGVQYPNSLALTCMNDKISELTDITPGTLVNISYNTQVRQVNNRWFNNINLYKLVPANPPQQPQGAPVAPQQPQQPWNQPQAAPQQAAPWNNNPPF